MTREEFVKLHGDKFLAILHRAFFMRGQDAAIECRWMESQVHTLNEWLSSLHDALTELKNAQDQKQSPPKPDAKAAGGPQANATAGRRAG